MTIKLNTSEASGEAYWRKRCDVVEAELTRLRAVNAELEKAMARMTGEICRADNALAESGPNYVSGASLADGIRGLTMDNAKFRELLGLALSDSKCGAEDDFFTVATECTEGKCWHIKARAALSRAEQAKPETCVWKAVSNPLNEEEWYETECKNTSTDIGKFCLHCGKRVEVKSESGS